MKDLKTLLDEAPSLKPKDLFIKEAFWKFLLRNAYKGRNVMMTGPTGTGKTFSAQSVAKVLNRPYFYFNMGSTQDPRTSLIGNTFFQKDKGTYFSKSKFIQALETENAIILLDELTRSHPEAVNILMSITDLNQRYIRLDEADDQTTIHVAKGVCFIGTSNIGAEYTSTRTLDRAFNDRFLIVEMEYLNREQEFQFLKMHYPKLDDILIKAVAHIACDTRDEVTKGEGKISTAISTRNTREICDVLTDDFTLEEAVEVLILPLYDSSGGTDSERVYVRQIIQKHMPIDEKHKKKLYDDKDYKFDVSGDNPFS